MKRICLLCPTIIPLGEIYCSPCGYRVWAIRSDADEHGGKCADRWKELQAEIERATKKRQACSKEAK